MTPAQNKAMHRIRVVSQRFAIACIGLMAALLTAIAAYWLTVTPDTLSRQWLGAMAPVHALTPLLRCIGFSLTMMAAVPVLLALKHLRHLFLLYAKGTMFSESNVQALSQLGSCLILFAVVQAFFEPVMGLMLSIGNPPGQRMLSVSVSAGMLVAAFIGGVLLVIAWVMNEARKIDEERQLTV